MCKTRGPPPPRLNLHVVPMNELKREGTCEHLGERISDSDRRARLEGRREGRERLERRVRLERHGHAHDGEPLRARGRLRSTARLGKTHYPVGTSPQRVTTLHVVMQKL